MATLLVYRGDTLIERIPVGEHDLRLGRQAENDVVLPDDGKAVSRYHAELRHENGKYVIYDLNSQNGTWVEASRVNRATLAIGQEAVIGPYRIRISAEDVQHEEAARPTMEAPVAAVTRPATRGSTAAIPPSSSSGTRAAAARPSGSTIAATGPTANKNAVLYGSVGVAALLVVAVAVWMLQAPRPESTQTQSTTTTIPAEPPQADPEMERLQAATQLAEAGSFAEAVSHLEPLLAANPTSEPAGRLWTRAQVALAPPPVPRASVPAPVAVAKPLEPGIERQSAESDAAYLNRIEQARSQYAYGDKMLEQMEWVTARQFFERLAAIYPGFRDVGAKARLARDRLDEAARAAIAAGRKLEDGGAFTAAVTEYTRAQTLGADTSGDIARANTTARTTADGLMKRAKVFENYADRDAKSRGEAVKLFRQIVELLPEGDPERAYAESRLLKLAP